jgi:uncharacterized protein YecT (DUF1311 family)
MLRFLSLAMLLLISCVAGSAQEPQKPSALAPQMNPCASANTQIEMNQCSNEEYKKVDSHLNAVYKNLLSMLQSDSYRIARQKLRAAQRAWIQYRDLHCDAVRQQWEGGSISPLEWSGCMTETTNDRIAELKSGYENGERVLE